MLSSQHIFAQLGFCEGSKGDPIFHEDFGSGNSSGPSLPPGTTNYTYVTGDPQDGQYTISNEIGKDISGWHSSLPQTTLSNGKALIINADYTAGQFYRTKIAGLCENTTYEFSAFLINILSGGNSCQNGGIPINVKFQIWDENDTDLLAEGNTGNIAASNNAMWEQYALTFQSEPGQESVILKMFNNGEGGCGNDLAIDDIIFRSCGDLTKITSEDGEDGVVVCEPDTPVSLKLMAIPDFSVYKKHFFQWQESDNNEDWNDIQGEIYESYTTPQLTSSKYYRVKVAEDEINLSNNLCSSASEAYYINIVEIPEAPESNGDMVICSNDNIPVLSVRVQDDETVNWYDSPTGGNEIAYSSSFTPQGEGVFYAEAVKSDYDCEGSIRTSVSLTINESPPAEDEKLQLCANGELQLHAGVANMAYKWNTGETSEKITVDRAGNFSVIITSNENCKSVKNFEVSAVDVAGIKDINSDVTTVTITPTNEGEFEYSLDGQIYQRSNTFEDVSGGIYFAYIRDLQGCNTVSEEFPHIVVPKFITPNSDGYNDVFEMKGIEYFASSEIKIFDRYGKLLQAGKGQNFSWDGSLNGRDLPASDYWYEIIIENYERIKGHFSLKR